MLNRIKELVAEIKTLGGEAFDEAEEAGLFSAYNFLELHLGEDVIAEGRIPASAQLVTEAYIQFENEEELDRVFLYSDRPYGDTGLLESGSITEGKFVLPYSKLSELAQQGYGCIYQRSPDGHNGRSFVRYHSAFGENRRMVTFKMWDSSAKFAGNGFNQALFVSTRFEDVFVMPDIHRVEAAIAKMKEAEKEREADGKAHWERVASQLEADAKVLLLRFEQEQLAFDLLKKDAAGGLEKVAETFVVGINPSLRKMTCDDIDQFMLDAGLRAIGIPEENLEDREEWRRIHDSYEVYKKQLAKTGVAKIVFENGFLYVTQNYPIERWETCFEPVLIKIDGHIQAFMEKNQIAKDDLAAVLATGTDAEYPFVIAHLQRFLQKEIVR